MPDRQRARREIRGHRQGRSGRQGERVGEGERAGSQARPERQARHPPDAIADSPYTRARACTSHFPQPIHESSLAQANAIPDRKTTRVDRLPVTMSPAGRVRTFGVLAVAVVGAAAVSAAVAGGASAAHRLNGRYTTEIASTAFRSALRGTWRMTLRGGSYTFTFTGMTAKNVIISGGYTIAKGRITFKERSAACSSMTASGGCAPIMGCRGAGTYRFRLNGPTLSFVRVRDPRCAYRNIVLSGRFRRTR